MRLDGASPSTEEASSFIEEDFLSRIMESSAAESSGCRSPTENSLSSVGAVLQGASTSLRRAWSQNRRITTSLLDLVVEECKDFIVLRFFLLVN